MRINKAFDFFSYVLNFYFKSHSIEKKKLLMINDTHDKIFEINKIQTEKLKTEFFDHIH